MRLHPNARSCPHTRGLFVRRVMREGWTVPRAAAAAGFSPRTGYKWLSRFRFEGSCGLEDRRSVAHRVPRRTPPARIQRIMELRQRRLTAWQIAQRLGMPPATVSAVLRRLGLGKLSALEEKPAVVRYERARPGELVHVDVKLLGRIGRIGHRITGDRRSRVRGIGWEYVHVAVDDASRLAYVEVLEDQKGLTAVGFFERAQRWFGKRGIAIERVMTDNGSAYVSKRFRQACKRWNIRHLRTKPYRPETNGKAERFIQTLTRGWAYRRPYGTSNQRTKALPKWLRYYNEQRPHRALGMISPLARIRSAA
ncbi:MAG TPA: IS481 family transposase [Deltaproteobacteria bacterium]|nr:IS481 family transposase [Deltaproteobacteria bacterium]